MSHRRIIFVAGAATLLLLVGGAVGLRGGAPAPAVAAATVPTATERLDAGIAREQQRLSAVPGDWTAWASLGLAYLERARISADPAWYPKAEGALERSLAVKADGNVPALVGLGALANARHDFAAARDYARWAIAADAYSADAYGVLADALTQLGRPADATAAVQRMLDLRPGLAAYARASYDLEQHGRLDAAETLMRAALDAAVDRSDIAFCRYQLGELEWQAGDLTAAASDYAAGVAADPDYLPLAEGQAKLAAARGDTATALRGYAALTAKYPTPNYLIGYAALLRSTGSPYAGELTLAGAAEQLFTANGGSDDLGVATLAIAAGHYAEAVAAARREWAKRHFSDVADVLAWALHLTGRDREALGYARQAVSLGSVNARFHYHLGAIAAALGDTATARHELTLALAANPRFDPLDAPAAQALLARIGAR